jgi:hypothetical protein
VDELKMLAENTSNCIAFNTLGFLKSNITYPLIGSRYYTKKTDGLYIRKEKIFKRTE